MPSDYLSGIQVGAQVGNMMAQRQERLIELRAQAAQQQIHERYVAAQVDQLNSQIMENAQKLKEQQDKSLLDDATRAAAPGLYNKNLMETFDGESVDHEGAMRKTIGLISLTNPDVAKEMATAFKSTQADPVEVARIRAAQSGANVAAQQTGANQRAQLRFASTKSPNGYAPSVSEKDALALQRASDDIDKAHLIEDPVERDKQVTRTEKYYATLETGIKAQHPDKLAVLDADAIRTELGIVQKEYWSSGRDPKLVPKIDELKQTLHELTHKKPGVPGAATGQPAATSGTNAAVPELKLGKIYVDKAGKRAIYQGGDVNDPASWKAIP